MPPKEGITLRVVVNPCGVNLDNLLTQIEIKIINWALKQTKGNKKRAAILLNLNRTTLVMKIKRFSGGDDGPKH